MINAISKQEIYNKRIDTLIAEVSSFVRKVYLYIENEPNMKKNLQILGAGASLSDKHNIFEACTSITWCSMSVESRIW